MIDLSNELGPALFNDRLDQILMLANNLLEQKNANDVNESEGDFEDVENDEGEDEDIDHNEAVIANVAELVSCIARSGGEDFTKYFEKTGELLFMHLQDHYPMRDKSICIGTLADCFLSMPSIVPS
mmetsp:Transcript_20381/g.20087  ORF Transcript_20381/g.20087 Transcript_20381/m.20087 type:complete len:126 (+) Transcript_20381:2290-2667(+)